MTNWWGGEDPTAITAADLAGTPPAGGVATNMNITAPGAAGGTPVTSGGTSVEALRADAMAAIQLGRDPAAVRARFQKLTGQTL